MSERKLRDYQIKAIHDLRVSLRSGKKRPVLQLATGGGKTVIAGEIISLARSKGHKVLFVVPAISLIDQTIKSFWDHGIRDVGVIQADHPLTDPSKPVQVASIQTLIRRKKPEFNLAIVDECHRQFEKMNDWLKSEEMQKIPVIGVSATPWAKGMAKTWDDLIVCATTQQMIDDEWLCKFRVFAPTHPDLSGVKVVAGDYHEGQLGERMNKPKLVADIVETWIRMGEGRPTLCFAVNCAHAKALQDKFESSGIPAGYIDAYTDSDDREIIRKKFHSGEYKVVVNVGTLTTGVDWNIWCIILARPTKSEMLFCQIIGRGLRLAEGKESCLILDHSNTHTNLGFVTDIIHEELDDGKPKGPAKKSERLPKECPKCQNLRPVGVVVCPACGFKPEVKDMVQQEEGELIEISRKGREKGGPANCIRMGGIWVPFGEFYGMLKFYAREKGYKEGWASNKYRSVLGVWPNAYKFSPAIPPSWEVEAWIKADQRKWAKQQPKSALPSSPWKPRSPSSGLNGWR